MENIDINIKRKKFNDENTLIGMSLIELEDWSKKNGESKFRGKQIYEWMYKHIENDPMRMLNISENYRELLKNKCTFSVLKLEKASYSNNEKTTKFLFKLLDNQYIETVSMIDDQFHTVCISSQVGCNIDCKFCATASMGFIRNLSCGEIVEQLIYIKKNIPKPITNIVYMGMGEPFLNYDNVIKSADIFHNSLGFGLSAKRITISTAGIVPKIKKFIKDNRNYKLAISLNAPTDFQREKIMPINRIWPLDDLISVSKLFSNRKRKNIMFEYVLLENINDSKSDAENLMNLIKGIDSKINIIPYNETDGKYKRPKDNVIDTFIKILLKNQKKYGYRVLVRWSKGQDINAGCGQLAVLN
tara:strand:- start:1923 stop:2996 length:1074 start_codon:yes stop_codon:yes gene_type:complete